MTIETPPGVLDRSVSPAAFQTQALRSTFSKIIKVAAHADLVGEGDRPRECHVLLSGLACRYRQLPNGKRQILCLLFPGDFLDIHALFLPEWITQYLP